MLKMSQPDELRVILAGSTGSGISSTGNTILQATHFPTKRSGKSVTLRSERVETFQNKNQLSMPRKKIILFDNPGFFCTEIPNKSIFGEYRTSLTLSKPEIHAFVYVIKIGRLPTEEEESIKTFLSLFGEEVLPFVLVVFTYKNELDGQPLKQYISTLPKSIRTFCSKCELGYIAIDNRTTEEESSQQMQYILSNIYNSEAGKLGKCYHVGALQVSIFEERMRQLLSKPSSIPSKFSFRLKKNLRLRLVFVAFGLVVGGFVLYQLTRFFWRRAN